MDNQNIKMRYKEEYKKVSGSKKCEYPLALSKDVEDNDLYFTE